jgi:hypothetical protein
MNSTTSVRQREPEPPAECGRVRRLWQTADAAAGRQFLDLVDRGRWPSWAAPVGGVLLVAVGIVALVTNQGGG